MIRALRVIAVCLGLACAARSDSATPNAAGANDAPSLSAPARPGSRREVVRMPAKRDSTARPLARDPGRARATGTPVRQVAVTVLVIPGPQVPQHIEFRRPWPNPASTNAMLRFSIAEASPVTISVYSIFGQKVATPVRVYYPPGDYEVRWPTTDDRGRRLAPGMYVVRMTAGRQIRTQKLAITR